MSILPSCPVLLNAAFPIAQKTRFASQPHVAKEKRLMMSDFAANPCTCNLLLLYKVPILSSV